MRTVQDCLQPLTHLTGPNHPVPIFKGNYELVFPGKTVAVTGEIHFRWLPHPGVCFTGSTTEELFGAVAWGDCNLHVAGSLETEKVYLTRIDGDKIEGNYLNRAVTRSEDILVDTIRFEVANLRELSGDVIRHGAKSWRGRLVLDNGDYLITLDKKADFTEAHKKLERTGGYQLLYTGEIKSKNGTASFKELSEVLYDFAFFLKFINGRHVAPLFRIGIFQNEVVIRDYAAYSVADYKHVSSWIIDHETDHLSSLWSNFSTLFKNPNDRDCLLTSIHWYSAANSNDAQVEGAVVLMQNGLELLYNWFIEKKILAISKRKLAAAEKINLLLSHCNINPAIPAKYTNMHLFATQEKTNDAPEIITAVRNALVHGSRKKRIKLNAYSPMLIFETTYTGLYYIELLMLYLLGYQEKFSDRTADPFSGKDKFKKVPWVATVP